MLAQDDGNTVNCHSLILVLASPVFREMLTKDDGTVLSSLPLPGKLAAEFRVFIEALQPASLRFEALSDEGTYVTLCEWAHEFEVAALKTLCEDVRHARALGRARASACRAGRTDPAAKPQLCPRALGTWAHT